MQQIVLMFMKLMKLSSVQKRLSKFMPKYFYEIDPWGQSNKEISPLIYSLLFTSYTISLQ